MSTDASTPSTSDSGNSHSERGTSHSESRTSHNDSGTDDHGTRKRKAKSWLLLKGSRLRIAGVIVVVVLLLFLVVPWRFGATALGPSSPMYFLFSSLVTGDLTLVTVVLSINQLVLSRELGSPGTLRQRIEQSIGFRQDVEETVGRNASPNSPGRFLQFLHEQIESEVEALRDGVTGIDDDQLRRRILSLSKSLADDVETVNRTLDGQGDSAFAVVAATLTTNHSDQIHDIDVLLGENDDALAAADLAGTLDTVESNLLQIDVARKYFKTVYVQKELAHLSRVLLYAGVPAIVTSGLALVAYNAATTTTVSPVVLGAVATVAFTLGVAPLAILFAFVLRLAWIAERTTTVAPFSTEDR